MENGSTKQIIRNKPSIRVIIEKYLLNRNEVLLEDIIKHVNKQHVTFKTKTPRNSIVSILCRMQNVEHLGRGKYKIKR